MRRALPLVVLALAVALPASAASPGAAFYGLVPTVDSTPDRPFVEPALIRADGSGFTRTPDLPERIVWAPDGARMASVDRDGNIVVAAADGSGGTRLTADGSTPGAVLPEGQPDSSVWNASPTWAPDGSTLAWQKHLATDTSELWVAHADGSGGHRLAPGAAPTWSPAGPWLAALDGAKQPTAIRLVDTRDGHVRVVATGKDPHDLAWSPDGGTLAFVVDDRVELAPAAGGAPRTLWAPGLHGSATPWDTPYGIRWSPDGTRLVFVASRDDTGPASSSNQLDVFSAPAAGGEALRLTTPLEGGLTPEPPHWVGSPSFWPDGSRLFYADVNNFDRQPLWEMNTDGTCKQPFPLEAQFGSWRPGTDPGLGPLRCADLGVHVAWPGGNVLLSRPLTVPVTVWNDGNLPAQPRIVVSLAPLVRAVSTSAPCNGLDTPLVDCTLPELAPHALAQLTLTLEPLAPGTQDVRIRVLGGEADPLGNNDAQQGLWVQPCTIMGTEGPDVLKGGDGGDHVCGLGGADVIVAGRSSTTILAGAGNDTIHAVNGIQDVIDCGPGKDTAYVDARDKRRRCERVVVRKPTDPFNLPPASHPERARFDDAGVAASPDGRRIAFWRSSSRAKRFQLVVSRSDGRQPRVLTTGKERGTPLWSPDGRWLVFENGQLWIVASGGGRARQLTHEESFEGISALRWRAGGIVDYAVVDCCLDHIDYEYEASVTLDGRQVSRPDFTDDCFVANGPYGCLYAPDGQSVLLVENGRVFVEDASGSRRLGEGGNAAWAPDGAHVFFVSAEGPDQGRLVRVRTDGTDRVAVSPAEAGAVAAYAVSNAGDRVAVVAGPTEMPALWVVGSDGREPQRILEHAGPWRYPWWSPHDRWLAQYDSAAGARVLRTMTPSGTDPRQLVTWQLRDPTASFFDQAFWSFAFGGEQDELGVFVDRPRPGCGRAQAIFRVAAATGRRTQVTHPCRPA
jgi:Tol biopolymer transport system component